MDHIDKSSASAEGALEKNTLHYKQNLVSLLNSNLTIVHLF